MTDNESLEQQAAAWVPPWARTPAPEESKSTASTDPVEEEHLLDAEQTGPGDGTVLADDARIEVTAEPLIAPVEPEGAVEPDAVAAVVPSQEPVEDVDVRAEAPEPADPDLDTVECGPDDLAGPMDDVTDESRAAFGEGAPAFGEAAFEDGGEPADPDTEAAAAEPTGVESLKTESVASHDDVVAEPAAADEAAVTDERVVVEGTAVTDEAAVHDDVAAPVDPAADAVESGDAAADAVEELAEALGTPVGGDFDVDAPDDSGEAAMAVASSKLAAPPPGLAADELIPALEAILLVVDEPVSEITLAEVLEVPAELVAGTLIDLSAAYTRQNRGFDLRRAAGGWRLYTRAAFAPYVERFVLDGQQLRLTQASLETLAVVAYKQPVTRSRISAIRGVNCDGVIRTLVTRGMIEECGTEPESGAHLYRTTSLFLEKLGLDSVSQLPPLAPFLPDNVEEIADEQR